MTVCGNGFVRMSVRNSSASQVVFAERGDPELPFLSRPAIAGCKGLLSIKETVNLANI